MQGDTLLKYGLLASIWTFFLAKIMHHRIHFPLQIILSLMTTQACPVDLQFTHHLPLLVLAATAELYFPGADPSAIQEESHSLCLLVGINQSPTSR